MLLVHNYLTEYPSLLSGVLFQFCDFLYKQTAQISKSHFTNQVTMNLIELSPLNEFRHKRQVATGRKFKIIRSFVLSFRKLYLLLAFIKPRSFPVVLGYLPYVLSSYDAGRPADLISHSVIMKWNSKLLFGIISDLLFPFLQNTKKNLFKIMKRYIK